MHVLGATVVLLKSPVGVIRRRLVDSVPAAGVSVLGYEHQLVEVDAIAAMVDCSHSRTMRASADRAIASQSGNAR